MDLGTILGLVLGIGVIVVTMLMTGGLGLFWDAPSILCVVGGAVCATMIRWPLNKFLKIANITIHAIKDNNPNLEDLIAELIDIANIARKSSILALEKVTTTNKHLEKVLKTMVDGNDPDTINGIIELDIYNLKQRHKMGKQMLDNLSEGCPAFGMIGTVIGLIVIMANLDDPNAIGPGLAVALVTTLYGALFANLFFSPLASKLQVRSDVEVKTMLIIKEATNGILNGINPRAIEEKLQSFV